MRKRVRVALLASGFLAGCQAVPPITVGPQSAGSPSAFRSTSSPLPAGASQRPAIAAAEVCRARGVTGSAYADCFDAELAARSPTASPRRTETSNPDLIDGRARRDCWGIAPAREVESFDACVRRRTAELNAAAQSGSANSTGTTERPALQRTWRGDDINAWDFVAVCIEIEGRVVTDSLTSSGYIFRCDGDARRASDFDRRLAERRRRTAELNAAAQSGSANSARTGSSGVMPRQDSRPGSIPETSRLGPPPPPPQASTTSGVVPLHWEIERRSEHCMMHAVNGRTRISLIARQGEINLFWHEPSRPTMMIHSLQRLRFEGTDGIWTVEGEALTEYTILLRGGSDHFAVRRIADVLGGGILAATEAQPVRVTLPSAGRLTVEFLHCIDSLRPQQERPSPPTLPRERQI